MGPDRRIFDPVRICSGMACGLQGARSLIEFEKWNDLMSEYQQKVPEADEGDWWYPMSLAFDSAWQA